MKNALMIAVLAATAALTGCANQPTEVKTAAVTPAQNIYAFKSPSANTVSLTLIRDHGWNGSGCDVIASVNGTKAARIASAEKAVLYVPEGNALVTAHWECPLPSNPMVAKTTIELVKGLDSFVRVDTSDITIGRIALAETTTDNPSFVCRTPSISNKNMTKAEFITAMRMDSAFMSESRKIARKMSVEFRNSTLDDCLAKNETDYKAARNPVFQKLKASASSPEEKAALIDAYSKYLTVIDANMSINAITQIQADFDAAVNKYELY
ncbi:hypothetical protein SB5439_05133 [Klebsiella variicola]|uniref:hypothetical protein n=1 Tax=Klebsiella variicola TaxID=244366 RepID=UPI00109CC761|nr:hypothetical protein [Klebsiella variicola]VGQ13046.1 hypothetical protein SB5439_05133 [Klebsiella variicola]